MTLIEILTVIVVIGVLMGIVGLSARASFKRAKKTRAEVEARSIAMSLKAYYETYGFWPINMSEGTYVDLGGDLLKLLTGETTPNNIKAVFLEVPPDRIKGGYYIDPWTNAFQVKIETMKPMSTNEYVLTVIPPLFDREPRETNEE